MEKVLQWGRGCVATEMALRARSRRWRAYRFNGAVAV